MNHYSFDDMEIGKQASFDVGITDEKMAMFAELSGDLNPMHVDSEYAISRGYKDKIVYGMLASSMYSTLVGMYLPGEKCLLNKCDVTFRRPVYVGDIITVYGEVSDKREATRRCRISGKMVNQDDVVVNTAEIMISFTGE